MLAGVDSDSQTPLPPPLATQRNLHVARALMAIDRQEDTPLPPLQQEDTPDPIDPVYGQTSLEPPTSSVSNDNGTYSSAHRTNMGNFGSKKTTEWSPAQYFDAQRREDDKPFALLILNQEITDLSMLENLWNNSELAILFETNGPNL